MKNKIIIFSVILLASTMAKAAVTGAQFLKIDTDARISALASAGTASAIGISALSYNPAGLNAIKGPEVAISHSKWLMESNHDFVGFGLPVKGFGLGIGLTRLTGLSFGAGIMALGAQLDYAMSPEAGLGSIQRITLKKRF